MLGDLPIYQFRVAKHLEFDMKYHILYDFRTSTPFKVQMKWFFIAEFERSEKIRKIAVYRFLISFLAPELQQFKEE